MSNMLSKFFSLVSDTIEGMVENMEDLNNNSGVGSRNLDEILKNPEDRIKFEEVIEKLKTSNNKSEVVEFSDRTLEISIE